MQNNPYAPPKAVVEGAPLGAAAAPPLWNPNAAANWCLLFSPMFGAWIQMKNWTALGQTQRAASSRTWLIISTIVVAGSVLLDLLLPRSTLSALTTPIAFLTLIVWYFASGRPHAKWVDQRFGADYPRRGWMQPLLWGLCGYVVVIAAGAIVGFVSPGLR